MEAGAAGRGPGGEDGALLRGLGAAGALDAEDVEGDFGARGGRVGKSEALPGKEKGSDPAVPRCCNGRPHSRDREPAIHGSDRIGGGFAGPEPSEVADDVGGGQLDLDIAAVVQGIEKDLDHFLLPEAVVAFGHGEPRRIVLGIETQMQSVLVPERPEPGPVGLGSPDDFPGVFPLGGAGGEQGGGIRRGSSGFVGGRSLQSEDGEDQGKHGGNPDALPVRRRHKEQPPRPSGAGPSRFETRW